MLRPMDESGFDTLKATRALEAAGFESAQAEAMVTVLGGTIAANVATKWHIRDLKDEIGALQTHFDAKLERQIGALQTGFDAKLEQQIGTLRTAFDAKLEQQIGAVQTGFDAKLEQQIGAVRTGFDAKLEQQIGSLRTELRSEIAEVRLSVESLRATMYKLLLAQAAVIVGLILGLQRLL